MIRNCQVSHIGQLLPSHIGERMRVGERGKYIALLALVVLLIMLPTGVHAKQVCRRTVLFPLTFHPEKPEHTIMCHPVDGELKQAYNAAKAFNSGIILAQHHPTILKCPSNDNDVCSGWRFEKRYLK